MNAKLGAALLRKHFIHNHTLHCHLNDPFIYVLSIFIHRLLTYVVEAVNRDDSWLNTLTVLGGFIIPELCNHSSLVFVMLPYLRGPCVRHEQPNSHPH